MGCQVAGLKCGAWSVEAWSRVVYGSFACRLPGVNAAGSCGPAAGRGARGPVEGVNLQPASRARA
eukprot:208855-Chlamydomonas_euryale.AAC.1